MSFCRSPAVLLAAMLLAASAPFAHAGRAGAAGFEGRAVDLSAEYDRARDEFVAFLESPGRFKDARRWDSLEDRFERIHERDPGGARADEALFMVGEVNYERHRVFRRREDLDAAIAAYRRLLETYRFSSRTGDALARLADIHYYNLNDTRRAYLLYRRAARSYPETEAGRRAGVRAVAIEARHPEYITQDDAPLAGIVPPPRSAKPLPSPGAVLGGRAGRRAGGGAPEAVSTGRLRERPAAGAGSVAREAAPPPVRRPVGAEASRPAHPLLEEGTVPFKRPSDDLPSLRSLRPR